MPSPSLVKLSQGRERDTEREGGVGAITLQWQHLLVCSLLLASSCHASVVWLPLLACIGPRRRLTSLSHPPVLPSLCTPPPTLPHSLLVACSLSVALLLCLDYTPRIPQPNAACYISLYKYTNATIDNFIFIFHLVFFSYTLEKCAREWVSWAG